MSGPPFDYGTDELGVRRPRAGCLGTAARRAAAGAVARSGAHGGHSLGHGRRRPGRRSAGAVAAGQPRRAGDAARGRRRCRAPVSRGHPPSGHRRAAGRRPARRADRGAASWRCRAIPGRTFVARAAAVSPTGGGGAVLVLHDITDLRRADQIRRDFVANVSHELRTPLTAIRGYVEALLEEEDD